MTKELSVAPEVLACHTNFFYVPRALVLVQHAVVACSKTREFGLVITTHKHYLSQRLGDVFGDDLFDRSCY